VTSSKQPSDPIIGIHLRERERVYSIVLMEKKRKVKKKINEVVQNERQLKIYGVMSVDLFSFL